MKSGDLDPLYALESKLGFVDIGWAIERMGGVIHPAQWRFLAHVVMLHREANKDVKGKYVAFRLDPAEACQAVDMCRRTLTSAILAFLSARIIARDHRGHYFLNPRLFVFYSGKPGESWKIKRFQDFEAIADRRNPKADPESEVES